MFGERSGNFQRPSLIEQYWGGQFSENTIDKTNMVSDVYIVSWVDWASEASGENVRTREKCLLQLTLIFVCIDNCG